MVIQNSKDQQKQKELERKLSASEDERKEDILGKLRKESSSIITLAYMYAKNFEETGADITQRWATMQEQNAILQQVYNRGYEEGLDKGRALEHEKYAKIFDNALNGGINGIARQNPIPKPYGNLVQPTNAKSGKKSAKHGNKR